MTGLGLHNSDNERLRIENIKQLLPQECSSVLEIGARHGFMTEVLVNKYSEVTALDLEKPNLSLPNCTCVAGNICNLEFADQKFDLVVCTEVLEHISDLQMACSELFRVAGRYLLIGVPFNQDTRVGRTTCLGCMKHNPPWGHVNTFTLPRILQLFPNLSAEKVELVGAIRERTNALSAFLFDLNSNPWGTYGQEERCIFCNSILVAPQLTSFAAKLGVKVALLLNQLQEYFLSPQPIWIHVLLKREKAE